MEEMSKSIMDHSNCLEKCSWPYLHGDIEQMNTNNYNDRLSFNRCTLNISKKFSLLTSESLAMNVAFLKKYK